MCRYFISTGTISNTRPTYRLYHYIYNTACLLTFSCAHLEDRPNRNNTVLWQKLDISHRWVQHTLTYIYVWYKSANRETSSYFQMVNPCQGCEHGINSSLLLEYRGEERTLISHLLMLTDLLTVAGWSLRLLFISSCFADY